jgi:C_GCAxxG_C_C family probable redox protein
MDRAPPCSQARAEDHRPIAMTTRSSTHDRDAAIAHARSLFLDDANVHGCAESTMVALASAFRLPGAGDSSAAMALNGGIAYSGSTCGAITGAAVALGRLAAARVSDHVEAKRVARKLTGALMTSFDVEFGATACRTLLGLDLSTEAGHRAFIEAGAWRDTCLRQIEFVVGSLAPLADEAAWLERVREVETG